jgi:hypothetical protein
MIVSITWVAKWFLDDMSLTVGALSKVGPSTIPILLGVILFTSAMDATSERNWHK